MSSTDIGHAATPASGVSGTNIGVCCYQIAGALATQLRLPHLDGDWVLGVRTPLSPTPTLQGCCFWPLLLTAAFDRCF
eukprot:911682-Rhodomonas_salina.1